MSIPSRTGLFKEIRDNYIFIVTKILRKICATTFTQKLQKITREGERLEWATKPSPIH